MDTTSSRAWSAAGNSLPLGGTVFLTVNDRDKPAPISLARRFAELGFRLVATKGTAEALAAAGLAVEPVLKVHEGRPHVVDGLINGDIQLAVNTPLGRESQIDDTVIRKTALKYKDPGHHHPVRRPRGGGGHRCAAG